MGNQEQLYVKDSPIFFFFPDYFALIILFVTLFHKLPAASAKAKL